MLISKALISVLKSLISVSFPNIQNRAFSGRLQTVSFSLLVSWVKTIIEMRWESVTLDERKKKGNRATKKSKNVIKNKQPLRNYTNPAYHMCFFFPLHLYILSKIQVIPQKKKSTCSPTTTRHKQFNATFNTCPRSKSRIWQMVLGKQVQTQNRCEGKKRQPGLGWVELSWVGLGWFCWGRCGILEGVSQTMVFRFRTPRPCDL